MTPVMQTTFWDPTHGLRGNCFQACIASVLDLPLEAVPHFTKFVWWTGALRLWLRGRGLDYEHYASNAIPDELCIVGGASPRDVPGGHAVIGQHGKIVHDPHPSGLGLTTVEDITLIVPWDRDPEEPCWVCGR